MFRKFKAAEKSRSTNFIKYKKVDPQILRLRNSEIFSRVGSLKQLCKSLGPSLLVMRYSCGHFSLPMRQLRRSPSCHGNKLPFVADAISKPSFVISLLHGKKKERPFLPFILYSLTFDFLMSCSQLQVLIFSYFLKMLLLLTMFTFLILFKITIPGRVKYKYKNAIE